MKEITLEQYKDFVVKMLRADGYYTEYDNTDGSVCFSLTNKVRGLDLVYATITREELEHQHENLNNEDLEYINLMLEVKE